MTGIRISKRTVGVTLALAAAVGTAGLIFALRPSKPGARTRRAHKIVEALRALPMSPLRLDTTAEPQMGEATPLPDVLTPTEHGAVRVTLPGRSTEPLHVEDANTGLGVDVRARDVFNVTAQSADGYFVYPHAHASGGTLLHRETEDGAEDFVSFENRPAKPEVTYDVALKGVHSVRVIENTFELLDADGTPRLRAAPPFIAGADGERTDATLVVENCTVDTDPAPPWGRDLLGAGSDSCTLRIRWNDEHVQYPAVLDPRWQSTGSMNWGRQDYTATMMSTGKVLAVGGRASATTTTGMTQAEIFDPATNTWTPTTSITGARYLHMAVQLGSTNSSTTTGRVFVGGGTTAGGSLNTAFLFSPTAGTWVPATNLNVSRHAATATLLSNGNVLLAGGLSGATVQNTAAVYNPSSGAGTFTPTGIMPQAVKFHTATLLKVPGNSNLNNKVLVVGGNSGTASVPNVQLFDGVSTWTGLTALSNACEGHTATALANGNLLVAGGRSTSSTPTTLNTTLLFNAATGSGTWASAGTLSARRQLHTATLLPSAIVENGAQVLVAGGSSGTGGALGSAEVWNGTTWTPTSSLPNGIQLQGQTATLLNNNQVLLAGGSDGSSTVATSVMFDGSFALQCTSNSQCATGFCVNGFCCDTACNGGCGVCNLQGHVGTCSAAASGTVCRAQNGICDVAETCSGTSLTCPGDAVSPLGTVCRSSSGACDVPETCDGATKACPADGFAASTTVCRQTGGAIGMCTGTSASCPAETTASANVLGFESPTDWSFANGGSVVGLNANHTQGNSSLEVAAQNYAPLNSIPLSAVGPVGTAVLLDFQLPVEAHDSNWFGYIQMSASSPSLGAYNVYLGQVNLVGLPLDQWLTLPFQMPSTLASQLSQGNYSDLTFQIDINVPYNETGHFLLDNLRFTSPVTPILEGIAQNSAGTTEAVFIYSNSSGGTVNIPYGPANALSNQNGFIASPTPMPPEWFQPSTPQTTPPIYVAALDGPSLTWTIDGVSATANLQSSQLPVTVQSDGTRTAQLPNGTTVNLDVGPADSFLAQTVVGSDTSYTAVDQSIDSELTAQGQTPNGPTSAGTLPGTFRVTDDGSAEYTIPIQTPPGRNGVEPHLSLVYNSRVGDGILGPGWTLQGVHKISRCRHPYSISNERGDDPAPITFTDSDDLCFDGERLIPFGTEFRTKRDQGSRFIVTSRDSLGPVSFQVFRKDGLIETYGGDDNSTNDLRGRYTSISIDPSVPAGQLPASPTSPVRLSWELASVADRFGNTMTYSYFGSVPHGTQGAATPPLLSSISYTAGALHPATK